MLSGTSSSPEVKLRCFWHFCLKNWLHFERYSLIVFKIFELSAFTLSRSLAPRIWRGRFWQKIHLLDIFNDCEMYGAPSGQVIDSPRQIRPLLECVKMVLTPRYMLFVVLIKLIIHLVSLSLSLSLILFPLFMMSFNFKISFYYLLLRLNSFDLFLALFYVCDKNLDCFWAREREILSAICEKCSTVISTLL